MVTNFVWPLHVPCNLGFEDLLVLKSASGNEGGIFPNKVRGILNEVCSAFTPSAALFASHSQPISGL